MFGLENRVAVIIGGNKGIGKAAKTAASFSWKSLFCAPEGHLSAE